MKLTRRGFFKTLCAIPFMTMALPKKENITFELKENLSGVLLVPEELESKARELMSEFHRGDAVSLDNNGRFVHFNGKNQMYGWVTGVRSDGWVEVQLSRLVRRGHE